MNCPKCDGEFEKVTFSGIEVERCVSCAGLWFDLMEKEDLLAIEGSEAIDIGDAEVGERNARIRSIKCPQCQVKMIPMIDRAQFHIQYESCPSCFGAYFDAGEFRDLKDHTVVERFMQMLRTLRTNLG